MKVIYLHQYFTTPDMPGGTRSHLMSARLVQAGHEVHVVLAFRDPTERRGTWRERGWKERVFNKTVFLRLPVSERSRSSSPRALCQDNAGRHATRGHAIAIPKIRLASRRGRAGLR